MQIGQLKERQKPLKQQYKDQPESARVTFRSKGILRPSELLCSVETSAGDVASGLHPAAGGDPGHACSGDMLLDALVACAGVTATAVAGAMGIELQGGTIEATAELDFRGTLAVDRETPIGIQSIQLQFKFDSDASDDQIEKLIELTERYCVILQTLQHPPTMKVANRSRS